MNIFVLDADPALAAKYHIDKHVIKMILESAQLLCTAHHVCGTTSLIPYKKTHHNHPSALWCRASKQNYLWLVSLGMELCKEYTHRYGKIHKTQAVIQWASEHIPDLPDVGLTDFAQAMPDDCKNKDPVLAYRAYYIKHKSEFLVRGKMQPAQWTNRDLPSWFIRDN